MPNQSKTLPFREFGGENRTNMLCSNCNYNNPNGCKYCNNCGAVLEATCRVCGNVLSTYSPVCRICGTTTSLSIPLEEDVFYDERDGQRYKTVKIGNQVWMAENLRYKKLFDYGFGCSSSQKGYYYYPDGNINNVSKYGLLYNWRAATMVAPMGWHLATLEDWKKLESALGFNDNASQLAGDSKSWAKRHLLMRNELERSTYFGKSGFNAIPAGEFNGNSCINFGYTATFWTSNNFPPTIKQIIGDSTFVKTFAAPMNCAFAVRCVNGNY